MPRSKISQLPTAGALTGAELVEIVQSEVNKKTTTQDIASISSDGDQAANTIKAGPTTGPAAAPTYRALVVNDLPNNIPFSKILTENLPSSKSISWDDGATVAGELNYEEFAYFRILSYSPGNPSKNASIELVDGGMEYNSNEGGLHKYLSPPIMPSYTVGTVPSAATYAGGLIYVSNESGGAVMAFSDGTNWRRVTDRNIIS